MSFEISNYDSLVEAAKHQSVPQRLLFLFLQSYLTDDHTEQEARRFEEGQGGGLKPLFHVDFAAEELTTFEELATESEKMSKDWQIVLVGCLGGKGNKPPEQKEVDEWLKFMEQVVLTGSPLSQFLAFDRSGDPVHFS